MLKSVYFSVQMLYNGDGRTEYRKYTETHGEEHYGIGAGWMVNIPSIDMTTDDNNSYASLYLPGKGTFSVYETIC